VFTHLLRKFLKIFQFLQPSYKQDYEKFKDKNVFKPTETEQYKAMKENEKASSDVSYRKFNYLHIKEKIKGELLK